MLTIETIDKKIMGIELAKDMEWRKGRKDLEEIFNVLIKILNFLKNDMMVNGEYRKLSIKKPWHWKRLLKCGAFLFRVGKEIVKLF